MNHGWEYKRLGDVCKIVMGQSPNSDSYNDDGDGLPFFQGSSDFGEYYPSIVKFCNAPSRVANENDILFSVRAPIGSMNIAPAKVCIGRGLCSISANIMVNQKFVYYWLKKSNSKLQGKGTGSTFRAIGKDVIHSHLIPIPSIEEQQAIVAELDAINEAMEVKRKQLKALNALAQAIFYDTFGDPIANPKGWPMKRLSEVGSIITGSTPSTHNELYYDSADIPFVKPGDILQDSVSYLDRTEAWISRFAYNTAARKLPQNTILVTCIGIIGKVAISRTECSCNQQINAIIPLNSVNPEYMARCIHAKRSVLSEIANGPIVSIINKSSFSKFPVPIPPFPLQQQFAAKVKEIECEKENVEATIARLQTLLDSRMDYWFND